MFTRREFLKIMAGSMRENETIIISTHLVEEIEHFIDRVLVLDDGRLAADAFMDDVHEGGGTLLEMLRDITGFDETKAARCSLERMNNNALQMTQTDTANFLSPS